jgi:hypothetical protein
MKQLSDKIKDIMKDPSAAYDSPKDVIDDNNLSHEEKSEILRCWEEDETAKQRAASENMPPPVSEDTQTTGDMLMLISKLRDELGQNKPVQNQEQT